MLKKQYMKTKEGHTSMREKHKNVQEWNNMQSSREYSKGQRKREESRQNALVKARPTLSKVSAPVVSSVKCSRKSSRIQREREQICVFGR